MNRSVWRKPLRILILSQFFAPEPNFKGLPFARELMRRGHEVEVLTGFPNYPGGKLYPGYRVRPWRREIMDGITVNRVPLYPSHDRLALRRAANYLELRPERVGARALAGQEAGRGLRLPSASHGGPAGDGVAGLARLSLGLRRSRPLARHGRLVGNAGQPAG